MIEMLCSHLVVKVVHAGRQTIRWLYHFCDGKVGAHHPRSVFDVRDAFQAVLGGYHFGLAEVVERVLYRPAASMLEGREGARWERQNLSDAERS